MESAPCSVTLVPALCCYYRNTEHPPKITAGDEWEETSPVRRCYCYPGAVSMGRSCCNPVTYSSNSSIVVFLSGSVLFSLRCWSSLEQVCCFSGSNSAGKDLKHCLHLVPDPSAWRFIACGCYGVITFYIYMSSFNVKDPGTSYKLLPCCRARQTTRHTQRARGGVSSKGTDSCASESLLCLEDLSSPQTL